ncbi:MAG TPA: cytochrome c maturation protein CcmE [Actinomycetota bacterium]|nr:cytochrome c maturation protein CcmE [Actinomycetota bacterium]
MPGAAPANKAARNGRPATGDNSPIDMQPRLRFAFAAIIVSGVVIGLIAWSISGTTAYYKTPSELLAAGETSQTPVRVAGKVVDGSIDRAGTTTTFEVSDGKASVPISTEDVLPDTFADGVEVVAEGAMTGKGYFSASTVIAKCPSKFKAKQTSS